MRFLITGTAGFIGFHAARRLLADGHIVDGVDGLTSYYDVSLKHARHALLKRQAGFTEHIFMLEEEDRVRRLAETAQPDVIIHLAAQAGVRHSVHNPRAYLDSNLIGSFHVMEAARRAGVKHLMLASTSSIYGATRALPFHEDQRADTPLSLYAATKKGMELIAHSHAHLWNIPTTIFRFFTVYGPWGRPDMAYHKFVQAILSGRPIEVYGYGQMSRDFTYVDDLVEAIVRLVGCAPSVDSAESHRPEGASRAVAPYQIVDIGGGEPVPLMDFIGEIERQLGRKAVCNFLPMQPGDVVDTFARAERLERLTGLRPSTPVSVGVREFVAWYRDYYGTEDAHGNEVRSAGS